MAKKQAENKVKHPRPSTPEETHHDPAILRLEKPPPPAYRRSDRECSGKDKQKEYDISSGTQHRTVPFTNASSL